MILAKTLCEEKETYDVIVFQEFLGHILNHYPEGKTVIILDKARIHHANLLKPFLEQPGKRIELV
ncbi:transposase [Trichococcus patagoniensis]|uniref:transposase n=1 Tax=Trichococcus patagoniensis TaxID=382641 RepID=UPI0014736972